MKNDSVILVRFHNGIGIDNKLNGFTLDGTPVKRKFYNGRMCYVNGNNRVGLKSLKESSKVRIELKNDCPF